MQQAELVISHGSIADGRMGDRYLMFLGLVLLGYALMGKGFAYLGFAPIYIGEMTLGLGLLVLLGSRDHLQVWSLPIIQILLVFVVWSAVCTLPYLDIFGFDALRDAALWGYSAFSIIVAALLIQKPERLPQLFLRYRRFVWLFTMTIWAMLLFKTYGYLLPRAPGTDIPIIFPKNGDALVHIGGVGAFIIAGLARANPLLLAAMCLSFILGNRAGMLACIAALAMAALLTPERTKVARLTWVASLVVVCLALFTPQIDLGRTTVSAQTLWNDATSIFTDRGDLRDLNTRKWRLLWWGEIIDYTVHGPYFWTGKGYGVNLSVDDGFESKAGESLRSPHNSHLSVLARSGVPGFLIYMGLQLAWLWAVFSCYLDSRKLERKTWMAVFTVLLSYWLAMMVNASFDVVLEGPMGGIWFWTVFGTGVAAVHLYRHRPELLQTGTRTTDTSTTQ